MKKYFYFCLVRFEDQTDARTGRVCRKPVTLFFGPHATALVAIVCNMSWMARHLGERVMIQGYDKKMVLDENHKFVKFEEEGQ